MFERRTDPSTSATTVFAPFRTSTRCQRRAASRAALIRASSSSGSGSFAARRVRRPNSPGCGVSTSRSGTARHHESCSASALRASASTTVGVVTAARNERVRRSVAGWRPESRTDDDRVVGGCLRCSRRQPPGATSPGASSSRRSIVSSGTWPSSAMPTDSEVATLTRPAPVRAAPRPASSAAPAYSREPATTSTLPNVPLWARAGRSGRCAATQRWPMPGTDTTGGRGARSPPRRPAVARG